MANLDEQISTLQERLGQLKLRQQRIEMRQHAIAALRERKVETRRKILLGGVALEKFRESEALQTQVLAWLDQALSRSADRMLFGLPPRPSTGDDNQGD